MSIVSASALITLARAKEYLELPSAAGSYDSALGDIINGISEEITNYCHRDNFITADYTEYYDGDDGEVLYVRNLPINSSASSLEVYLDTDREYATTDRVPTASLIIYASEGKIVLDGYTYYSGYQAVKVVYNAGYNTASVPYAVQLVCLQGVARAYKKAKHLLEGVDSESGGDISRSFDLKKDITEDMLVKLDPYVRYFWGCGSAV